ncbi:MAG: MmpS family transport accessory protein [Actinomycetota bacterium]
MTDSPDRRRDDPTQAFGGGYPTYPGYPGYSDPAYAGQAPYGSPYQPPRPTEQLPAYSPYGYDPYGTGQYPSGYGGGPGGEPPPPPEDPKPPRWLWAVAGIAVLVIVGLVIALVIVNSSRQQTVTAPAPAAPEPTATSTRPTPTTTSRTPRSPVLPLPTVPSLPTTTAPEQTTPGATDTVVYTVSGTGRVINITYVDTGGLLQTEFNVMLPWTREVSLPQPAERSASVSIINVGREVTCSISVNGTTVQERNGAGLTVCAARR